MRGAHTATVNISAWQVGDVLGDRSTVTASTLVKTVPDPEVQGALRSLAAQFEACQRMAALVVVRWQAPHSTQMPTSPCSSKESTQQSSLPPSHPTNNTARALCWHLERQDNRDEDVVDFTDDGLPPVSVVLVLTFLTSPDRRLVECAVVTLARLSRRRSFAAAFVAGGGLQRLAPLVTASNTLMPHLQVLLQPPAGMLCCGTTD